MSGKVFPWRDTAVKQVVSGVFLLRLSAAVLWVSWGLTLGILTSQSIFGTLLHVCPSSLFSLVYLVPSYSHTHINTEGPPHSRHTHTPIKTHTHTHRRGIFVFHHPDLLILYLRGGNTSHFQRVRKRGWMQRERDREKYLKRVRKTERERGEWERKKQREKQTEREKRKKERPIEKKNM